MGLSGISIPSLLIILVIVLLLFGTKRLRSLGGDLGGAIKGFKKAVSDDDKASDNIEDATVEEKVDASKTSEKQHSESK